MRHGLILLISHAFEFSGLTQELLSIPNSDTDCIKPQASDLEVLADELFAAEHQYNLQSRLAKYFDKLRDGTLHFDDPETILDKLNHSVEVMHQLCNLNRDGQYDGGGPLPKGKAEFLHSILGKLFDSDGYNHLVKSVLAPEHMVRFQQTVAQAANTLPHCDNSPVSLANPPVATGSGVKWPGGPFRLNFGFNLSQMITKMIMSQANAMTASSNPTASMVSMMAVMSVVSIIETVVAVIIDIVPPMIPPPFWILWSLPCLPMLTGANCLFSVLYPVAISDFMLAPTSDQQLDGVLLSFPSKYRQKVGVTSDADYQMCAMAYFGMHCAQLFPLCWIPIGIQSAMSFPMCFVHCLLTLLACPGFWIDDIIGPCMNVSVPPLCSFSLFVNLNRIPPQYVSYDEAHPYPQDCPEDEDPITSLAKQSATTRMPYMTTGPIDKLDSTWATEGGLGGDRKYHLNSILAVDDYRNVVSPLHYDCDCDGQCKIGDSATAAEYCRRCNCPRPRISLEEAANKRHKRDIYQHIPNMHITAPKKRPEIAS